MTTRIILIGGFLGAGKTTLLAAAAVRLAAVGHAVGLITNDQAPELVDTGLLRRQGREVREVAGSCFCCDFNGFKAAAQELHHGAGVDLLLGEPVGSCTDLSATIMQPLKDRYCDEFSCAPLTVLVDPERLRQILAGAPGLHPDAVYIAFKQLEEADHIAITKCDTLEDGSVAALREQVRRAFPDRPVHALSARSGRGVQEWLDAVLADVRPGRRVVAVDYDRYANGEAVLGWFNADYGIPELDPSTSAGTAQRILAAIRERCVAVTAAIGHVKLLMAVGDQGVVANLTDPGGVIEVRSAAGTAPERRLIINARVEMAPADLERLIDDALAATGISVVRHRQHCLSPGRPQPTHRYRQVVGS